MKNYLLIFMACSLLSCQSGKEPETPEETPEEIPYKIPCGCGNEWPQEAIVCQRELPWDYPVKPGTEEWAQLKSPQECFAACEIPEDVLTSLSTEDLTDICMLNPLLLSEVFSFSSFDRGLDSLFKRFNGVRELLQREDAPKGLLNWYKCAMQNLSLLYGDALDVEKGIFTLNIALVELLLSRYHAPEDNKDDYREIVQHLICGYEKMLMHPDHFWGFSLRVNLFSRVKIIIKIDEQHHEKLQQVEYNLGITDGDDYQTRCFIDELSCQLIH